MAQESVNNSDGASSSLSSTSPSSPTYSSETLADIAARVLHELNLSLNDLYDDNDFFYDENEDEDEDEVKSEFEFAVICRDDESNIVTADEIFYDGKIKPIYYPVFNTKNNNNVAYGLRHHVVSEKRERVKDNVYSEVMKSREKVNAVNNFNSYSYSNGRKKMEGVKRKKVMKTYLPYKRDLLGIPLMMGY